MSRFREADEAVKSKTTAALTWTSSGERLRAEPYGGFLVNFLCKENWNVGASGTLSKEGNVQIKINVFSSSDTAHSLTRSAVTPSPLGKAKNGRTQ